MSRAAGGVPEREDEMSDPNGELLDAMPELLEHVIHPRHLGRVPRADGLARVRGACGDSIEFSIRVREGRIEDLGHVPDGCAVTLACASAASVLAEGLTLAEARSAVSPMAIDAALGGLPEDHEHCARLAASAFWAAIDDALVTAREPWRRGYRS